MSARSIYLWRDSTLQPLEHSEIADATIVAADSWLVTAGHVLALDLHRARFLASLSAAPSHASGEQDFWDAAITCIPDYGDWFPRVEYHANAHLILRLRGAPERTRSAVLATWSGADPRTQPLRKGPDLDALRRVRASVQPADEAVILSPDGYVVEGAYSGLLWWRGDVLCGPPARFDRVDSVTTRTVLTLARALGFDTHEEAVTESELEGTELWTLSALHGIRIATAWVDGPALAERPGRLRLWRERLDALRKPLR